MKRNFIKAYTLLSIATLLLFIVQNLLIRFLQISLLENTRKGQYPLIDFIVSIMFINNIIAIITLPIIGISNYKKNNIIWKSISVFSFFLVGVYLYLIYEDFKNG